MRRLLKESLILSVLLLAVILLPTMGKAATVYETDDIEEFVAYSSKKMSEFTESFSVRYTGDDSSEYFSDYNATYPTILQMIMNYDDDKNLNDGDVLYMMVNSCVIMKTTTSDGTKINFSIQYNQTKSDSDAVNEFIQDEFAGAFLAAKDDYTKVKNINEYVSDLATYDLEGEYAFSVDSGRSTPLAMSSEAYAILFQKIAEYSGLNSHIMKGYVRLDTDYGHSWNIVQVDDEWYHVDCSLNDKSFEAGEDINQYLLLSDQTMKTYVTVLDIYTGENDAIIYDGYLDYFSFPEEDYRYVKMTGLSASYDNTPVYVGEEIDRSNITVSATYKNYKNKEINSYKLYYDTSTASEQTVKVYYNGRIATFDITVYSNILNVNYETDCDVVVPNTTVERNKKLESLPEPTREGYMFDGWFTTNSYTTKVTTDTIFLIDTTLYAKWTKIVPISIEATYTGPEVYINGTIDLTKVTVTLLYNDETSRVLSVAELEADGLSYTDGYHVSTYQIVKGNNEITITYEEFEDTITVVGYIDTFTVTFNSTGGVAVPKQIIDEGQTATIPSTSRTGYVFQGWFTLEAGAGTKLSESTVITEDITYYAYWVPFTMESITAEYEGCSVEGTGVLNYLTVTGHFNDGTESEVAGFTVSSDILVLGNQTITVSYVYGATTLTTTIDINGIVRTISGIRASYSGDFVYVGESIDESLVTVYSVYNDGSSEVLPSGYVIASYSIKEYANDLTIQYSGFSTTMRVVGKAPFITVSFDPQGGKAIADMSVKKGGTFTAPKTTRTGYLFCGWFTKVNGNGDMLSANTIIHEETVFYAYWQKISITKLEATYSGGEVEAGKSIDRNFITVTGTYNDGTASVITDYTIEAYTIEEGSNSIFIRYGGKETYITVTGIEPKVEECTITFNSQGGVSVGNIIVDKGSSLSAIPVTTKAGYTLKGWYTDASGTGSKLTFSTKINANITYYAIWSNSTVTSIRAYYTGTVGVGPLDLKSVMVRAYTADGSYTYVNTGYTLSQTTLSLGTNIITVRYLDYEYSMVIIVNYLNGSYINTSTILKKDIESVEANYNGKILAPGSKVNTADVSLLVTYSNDTYEVVTSGFTLADYTIRSGKNYITVKYGNVSATLEVDGEYYYTVTFNSLGGTSIASKSIAKNSIIGSLPKPTRDGYQFVGWYTSKAFTVQVSASNKVTKNIILYALWDETNPYELSEESVNVQVNGEDSIFVLGIDEKRVYWTSDNNNIANVSNGIVLGIKKGTTTITAHTDDGYELSCKVTVGPEILEVKPSVTNKTLKKGKSFTIKTTIYPSNAATKKLKYSSSDVSIATVNSKGKVVAKRKGTCYIYIKTTDSSNITEKIKITVK